MHQRNGLYHSSDYVDNDNTYLHLETVPNCFSPGIFSHSAINAQCSSCNWIPETMAHTSQNRPAPATIHPSTQQSSAVADLIERLDAYAMETTSQGPPASRSAVEGPHCSNPQMATLRNIMLSTGKRIPSVPAQQQLVLTSFPRTPHFTLSPKAEMHTTHGSSANISSIPTKPHSSFSLGLQQPQKDTNVVDPTRYKTILCRNFQISGFCPYDEVCAYAHGLSELRNVTSNSAAVQSLSKLASQITSKTGPVSLQSLGPLRYRKKKRNAHHPVDAPMLNNAAVTNVPLLQHSHCNVLGDSSIVYFHP